MQVVITMRRGTGVEPDFPLFAYAIAIVVG